MAKRNGHHWHLLSRGPLAPFNTSTTGTNMFFPIESAFEYSHQLNIAWHSRKITVA